MQIVSHQKRWKDDFLLIAKYLRSTLSDCEIIHIGPTSFPGMASLPIIDVGIVIPTINDLPFVNDCLQLLDYLMIGHTKVQGEYIYQNNNLDFPIHNINVLIRDEEAFLRIIQSKEIFLSHPEIVEAYNQHMQVNFPNEVSISAFYDESRLFVNQQLQLAGINYHEFEVKWPDFNNSLLNVTSAIQHAFGAKPTAKPLSMVNNALQGKDHVILILLDGMGLSILEQHLPQDAFLRCHLKQSITSIYPPTTVAATTMVQTGVLPKETAWIGWNQYFKTIDRHVIMFRNDDYYTDEHLSKFDAYQALPVKLMSDDFKNTYAETLWPNFRQGGYETFKEAVNHAIETTKQVGKTYTYLYWNEPDGLLHELGCGHARIQEALILLNQEVERLCQEVSERTCVVVVADHGLIDIKPIYINRFKDVTSLLAKRPALEGRTVAFYVKDKHQFPVLFNRYFSNYFDLYDRESFMATGLLGSNPQKCKPFLGDFIALAKTEYSVVAHTIEETFKAAHAGQTKEEMIVPLIIFEK